MEITLLRHGRPKPIPHSSISAAELQEWISQYNENGISSESLPSEKCFAQAKGLGIIVSSTLARSMGSAELLHTDQKRISKHVFVEAGLPYAKWSKIKMNPRNWAILFRALWYFGYSKNSESYSEAKEGAVRASLKLEEQANIHQSVLFVGHGIFNRLVAKELKNKGWFGPRNPGSKYWDFGTYKKST